MLGSLINYLKGMRRMMFQLSGFYYERIGWAWNMKAFKIMLDAGAKERRWYCGLATGH